MLLLFQFVLLFFLQNFENSKQIKTRTRSCFSFCKIL